MTNRSPREPVNDRVIHLTLELSFSPEEAYAYFTRPELLTTWLAESAEVEARVGGRYELFWRPEDPEVDSTIGCRITALEDGQLIAFQWRSPEQFRAFANTADPLTHVVVTFYPTEAGTRVHLVHSGWRSTPEWEEAWRWQERAWAVAFEALRRISFDE